MEPVSQQPSPEIPQGPVAKEPQRADTDTEVPIKNISLYPKYLDYISIFAGIIFALTGIMYSGKYLIPDLPLSLMTKSTDNVSAPGVGFDYVSNIYKIPSQVFVLGDQIKVLSIDYSHIGSPPKEISKLSSLKTLRLKNSGVKILPKEISNITTLETLDLGGNKIASLPESLGNLANLKTLLLYNNNIKSLPESFGSLTNLSILDLHGNKLKSLPPNISNLQNLQYLFLGGNNFPEQEKSKIRGMLPNTSVFF